MPRYWARWYEPAQDPWEKALEVIDEKVGHGLDSPVLAAQVVAALKDAEFELTWPLFTLRNTPHMVHCWQSGQSASGSYAVVCALFDAPSEQVVRDEIGECEGVSVDEKSDDWLPGDRFPLPAA